MRPLGRPLLYEPGPSVALIGVGLMGSQIGCEYALSGHPVVWVTRDRKRAARRVKAALSMAANAGICDGASVSAARARMTYVDRPDRSAAEAWLAVESGPEDMEIKVELLRAANVAWPEAILATNTSSISIDLLAREAGVETRLLGTHYWNPPLLMPLVEVVSGAHTCPDAVSTVCEALERIGKRPVRVGRDVPGLIWNRLQLALLRECLWLVEHGVATPDTIDEVVRDGLARRWRLTGPFTTVALGGATTFDAISSNLFPTLSNATEPARFGPLVEHDPDQLDSARRVRDAGLIAELRADDRHLLAIRLGRDGQCYDES